MIKEFKQLLLNQTGTPYSVYFRYVFESERYELFRWDTFEIGEKSGKMVTDLVMTILLNSNLMVKSGALSKNSTSFLNEYELFIKNKGMSLFVKFCLIDGNVVVKYFSFYAHKGYFLDSSGMKYSEQRFIEGLQFIFDKLSGILL